MTSAEAFFSFDIYLRYANVPVYLHLLKSCNRIDMRHESYRSFFTTSCGNITLIPLKQNVKELHAVQHCTSAYNSSRTGPISGERLTLSKELFI